MLHFKLQSGRARFLKIHHFWFSRKPKFFDLFKFSLYFHSQSKSQLFGFRQKPKFTILVDISLPDEDILKAASETTRYEVRRASRDNIRAEREKSLNTFCDFSNKAADAKKRGHLSLAGLLPYWPDMYVTKVMQENEVLAMHSYLIDKIIGRVALLHSVSLFRLEPDSGRRNAISRANRWLHYQDMLLFKRMGMTDYDFGGYAKNTTDPELSSINAFKLGFGGVVVEESNYISWIIVLWNRLRGISVTI